jgi:hypothetical protein
MHGRKLRSLWEDSFGPALTRPGLANALVVLSGWVLTQGTHGVTAALVATDVARRRHWEAFHRFFSRGTWSADELGRWLFRRIVAHLGDGPMLVVIDDTLAPKKGPHVFGIGSHLDAVRSTKRHRIFTFGHCWVVLAVVVRVPFSKRAWALPLLFRLARNLKECNKRGAVYMKKTQLAREMIDVLLTWVGARPVEITADSAYCNFTVSRDLPPHVTLVGAMRPDAVLTALPRPPKGSKAGRPRKRGALLPKPEKLAKDTRQPWQTAIAMLYGRRTHVRFKTLVGQWYRATGTRELRIVIVECTTGRLPIRVFFSSDPTFDVVRVLETYALRWGIEIFFRDAKQLLGFADSSARKEAAVRRVAPLVGLLYTTLVVWMIEGVHATALALPPIRPWYRHKRGLAFADVLRAAQSAIANIDVLDPDSDSGHLHKQVKHRTPPEQRALRRAA